MVWMTDCVLVPTDAANIMVVSTMAAFSSRYAGSAPVAIRVMMLTGTSSGRHPVRRGLGQQGVGGPTGRPEEFLDVARLAARAISLMAGRSSRNWELVPAAMGPAHSLSRVKPCSVSIPTSPMSLAVKRRKVRWHRSTRSAR